jgi:hypothetical protein
MEVVATFAIRNVTVSAALTQALHINPASGNPLGVAITVSPTTAPVTVMVFSNMEFAAIFAPFTVAVAEMCFNIVVPVPMARRSKKVCNDASRTVFKLHISICRGSI